MEYEECNEWNGYWYIVFTNAVDHTPGEVVASFSNAWEPRRLSCRLICSESFESLSDNVLLLQARHHLSAATDWIRSIDTPEFEYASVKFVDASGDEAATMEDARHQGV